MLRWGFMYFWCITLYSSWQGSFCENHRWNNSSQNIQFCCLEIGWQQSVTEVKRWPKVEILIFWGRQKNLPHFTIISKFSDIAKLFLNIWKNIPRYFLFQHIKNHKLKYLLQILSDFLIPFVFIVDLTAPWVMNNEPSIGYKTTSCTRI